jgi:hypothetical protein
VNLKLKLSATSNSQFDTLKQLLEMDVYDVNVTDKQNKTPLILGLNKNIL